ncbi:hypothetical protein D3C80_2240240 [compost metagenome]
MLGGGKAEEDAGPAEDRDEHDDFAADYIRDITAVEADHHSGQRADGYRKPSLGRGSPKHLGQIDG